MTAQDTHILSAQKRTANKKAVQKLRRNGLVPAVLYGHGVETSSLQLSRHDFTQLYKEAGESALVDLSVDDQKPVKVLIQDVQRHPVSGDVIHVDLHAIRMNEKTTAETELVLDGVAPAVKDLGGVLVHSLDRLKVECLPQDLPSSITVDVTTLKELGSHISVEEVTMPKGVTALEKPDTIVVSVSAPRSEEELAELEEKPEEDVEKVEVDEKGKKEEGDEEKSEQPESASKAEEGEKKQN